MPESLASVRYVRGAFEELRASTDRLRVAADRFLRRAFADASALVNDRPGAARAWPSALGEHAIQLFTSLRERRRRAVDALETRASRLAARAVQRLPMASRADVAELRKRIAALERRLDQTPRLRPGSKEANV